MKYMNPIVYVFWWLRGVVHGTNCLREDHEGMPYSNTRCCLGLHMDGNFAEFDKLDAWTAGYSIKER